MAIENTGISGRPRDVAFLVLAAALVLGAVLYFGGGERIGPTALAGRPAPDIDFTWETGKASSLAELKGSVVLLNFWASWCDPCIEEMPSLTKLESKLAPRGFTVLALNVEEPGEPRTRPKTELPRHLIYRFDRASLAQYRVSGIPLSVLIDKTGVIRRIYAGPVDWLRPDVIRDIETLLH